MTLTEDSVFLYNSVDFNLGNNIIEIGCGNGTMLKTYGKKYKKKHFWGIDINTENFKSENVQIIRGDIRDIKAKFQDHFFDIVISNPPYFKFGTGKLPLKKNITEKVDVELTIDDLSTAIKYLLRPIGFFYFVYPTYRLYETLDTLKKENLKPYKLQFRHARSGEKSDICLFVGKNRKGDIQPDVIFPNINTGV